MRTAIIGIGSNIDPEKNIPAAKQFLSEKYTLLSESEFIKTKPVGVLEQSDFVNGSVKIKTTLGFDQLKVSLKEIERSLDRQETLEKSGPRSIDLDILVWDGKIIGNDFYSRDFVKQSVLDLMPDLKF